MEESRREKIFKMSAELVADIAVDFKRYLYSEVDWDCRLVCIKGARGVGKTTMLLQRIAEMPNPDDALYVSLDNVWIDAREAYSLAEYHVAHGGTHLFIDEVHKLENWQDLVKSLNDNLRRLKVVYSGSSLLKLEKRGGDLSRRQTPYTLDGLSFREYLKFEGVADIQPFSLDDILSNHVAIARSISRKFPVLAHFDAYRIGGYYPFYKEEPRHYLNRIVATANQVLEVDYPEIEDVEPMTIRKARRMLNVLAMSAPLTPNMDRLYRELGTDRKQGLKMLYALERAGLLSLLTTASKESLKNLPTPDKIYCSNTNLMRALVALPNPGTMCETFFLNQLRHEHGVTYPAKGDFLVDGKYLFEVGGAGKGFDQIKDLPDSFVVNDDTTVGFGNKLPLWLFGFLY